MWLQLCFKELVLINGYCAVTVRLALTPKTILFDDFLWTWLRKSFRLIASELEDAMRDLVFAFHGMRCDTAVFARVPRAFHLQLHLHV
jgi:hypothetical protein